ncbi:uncharacterized protein LOC115233613 [Formica exsecta]|uniref:uncharacterized protein LOC115233613 n=1 Tax=Formica exsecta TaxID=72781 RepID=UPI001143F439|nr:uncharacterized protein LOC115233613 [Formica exsecta]
MAKDANEAFSSRLPFSRNRVSVGRERGVSLSLSLGKRRAERIGVCRISVRASVENGISETTKESEAVPDRDLDYAGASRIAKILPIRKKGGHTDRDGMREGSGNVADVLAVGGGGAVLVLSELF